MGEEIKKLRVQKNRILDSLIAAEICVPADELLTPEAQVARECCLDLVDDLDVDAVAHIPAIGRSVTAKNPELVKVQIVRQYLNYLIGVQIVRLFELFVIC